MRPALPAGALPTSVATGDFNGDGKEDFVVANALTNDLWMYLGKGDGTFQLPQIIPLTKGLSPVSLAAASLRHNGILDLVVAESDSLTIGVLLGNGDGTFAYESDYLLPESPESLVIDDFHHNGKLDIAVAMDTTIIPPTTQIPYIALLTGDGTGNFAAPIITNVAEFDSTAFNIASGDVNGDGLPDILLTGPGWENSTIFLNHGDGTFKPGAVVVANDSDFGLPLVLDGRLGDLNGDGCLDAVVADVNTMVWVSLGDCSGHFSEPVQVYMGANNGSVRLADVNGDGNLDILTSAFAGYDGAGLGMYGGNSISVALGDGEGNFSAARQYTGTGQSYSIGIADFTGSGSPDLVTAESSTDTATVYANDGKGGFGSPQGIYAGVLGSGAGTVNAPFSALSFVDINHDGKTDAFLLDEGSSGELYATSFLNDGTGKFTGPINSDTGLSIPSGWVGDHRLGDFRNTGKLDFVAIGLDQADSVSSQFILFMAGNGDGTFAKGTPVTVTGADGILTTGDFNHDGKLDFVAVNGSPAHTLTTFLGNGDGTFRSLAPVTFSDSSDVNRIYTGDFNRDGKLDVLVFTTANGYWTTGSTVWELDGNGDGTFQAPRQLFTGFQPLTLADVNGDGYPDIARYDFMWPDGTSENEGPARFTTYLDQPDGSFKQSSSNAPYTGIPQSVEPFVQNGDPLASSLVGAYSGDGKPDEAAFQYQQTPYGLSNIYAQLLMGDGDGTFTPTYDIFPFLGGYPIYAHDVTGDGIADMVQLNSGTSSLQVFPGAPAPGLQIELEESVVTGNQGCGYVFPDLASNSSQTVTLTSSIPGVTLPASVTIPAGGLSSKFCYTLAGNFNWRQVFDINATLNGSTATAYASDSYAAGFSEAVSAVTPSAVYQGQSSAPLTLTLASSQGYSSTANLSCVGLTQGDSCQFASTSLSVSPTGPATTTVTLVTAANAAAYGNYHSFTIVADDGNVVERQTVTLGVAELASTAQSEPSIPALSPGSGTQAFSVNGIPPYQFTCSGLPAGASCSISGTQQPFPSPSIINVTVNVPAGIANGNYPFTFAVASGTLTVSDQQTLQVISYSLQGPPASGDWAFPGTTQNIPINIQGSSNWWGGSVTVACSLDVAATCTGATVTPGTSSANLLNLNLSVPTGTALGQHQMTVTGTYAGSTQTLTFPVFIVGLNGSLNNSTLTLARGGSGTVTATLNASNGFIDAISLACSGTSQLTCSFSPSTPQVTGGTPQTVTVSISAGATASIESRPATFPAHGFIALAGLFPLALCSGLLRRRWRNPLLMLLVGFTLIAFMNACGGGGAPGGGGGGGSNIYSLTLAATPSGTSAATNLGTVTVTVTH